VTHNGKQRNLWSDATQHLFQGRICGFFNHKTVDAKIQPVKKGYRTFITFELIQTSKGSLVTPETSQMQLDEPIRHLTSWMKDFQRDEPDERAIIMVPFVELSLPATASFSSLTGPNGAMAKRGAAVAKNLPGLKIFIAVVEYIQDFFIVNSWEWSRGAAPYWEKNGFEWGKILKLVDVNDKEVSPSYIPPRFITEGNIKPRFVLPLNAQPAAEKERELAEGRGKKKYFHVGVLLFTVETEVATMTAADIML
jgi:hypothetical protein